MQCGCKSTLFPFPKGTAFSKTCWKDLNILFWQIVSLATNEQMSAFWQFFFMQLFENNYRKILKFIYKKCSTKICISQTSHTDISESLGISTKRFFSSTLHQNLPYKKITQSTHQQLPNSSCIPDLDALILALLFLTQKHQGLMNASNNFQSFIPQDLQDMTMQPMISTQSQTQLTYQCLSSLTVRAANCFLYAR